MKNIVFHIPHDGHQIPNDLKKYLIISEKEFDYYDKQMSDIHINELVKNLPCKVIKFNYSRLMCDVERFLENEPMEEFGMGFCYEKTFDGITFKKVNGKTKLLTKKYYFEHHKILNNLSNIFQDEKWLLIDLHSFNTLATRPELITEKAIPDICIGFDKKYCNKILPNFLPIILKNMATKLLLIILIPAQLYQIISIPVKFIQILAR